MESPFEFGIQCSAKKEEARRRPSLPLLLKLAAATLTGAAAFLSFRRHHHYQLVSSLRQNVHSTLLLLNSPPPTILITGFRAHGKSSFVNTAYRTLADEVGPLLLRAETSPAGPTPATLASHLVRVEVRGEEREEEEGVEVGLVDGTALPEAGRLTKADVEAALVVSTAEPTPECVVVVVRCGAPPKERHLAVRRLTDIASVVRERGLHLVVVLTQKKALKTTKQAEELRREVAFRARTDCVYFIENYSASNALNVRRPIAIKNDFETHLTVLTIVRQCIEFARMYRSRSSHIANAMMAPTNKLQLLKEH